MEDVPAAGPADEVVKAKRRGMVLGEDLAYVRSLEDEVNSLWRWIEFLGLEFGIETEPDLKLERFVGFVRELRAVLDHVADSQLLERTSKHTDDRVASASKCLRSTRDFVVKHLETLSERLPDGRSGGEGSSALEVFRPVAQEFSDVVGQLRDAAHGCRSYIGFVLQNHEGTGRDKGKGGENATS